MFYERDLFEKPEPFEVYWWPEGLGRKFVTQPLLELGRARATMGEEAVGLYVRLMCLESNLLPGFSL